MAQILAPAALGLGSGDPMGGAKAVADAADPGEIELALEIAPARQDLGRHRIEHRLEAYPIAGIELVALLRNVQPQPARLVAAIEPGQRIRRDHDTPTLFGEVDVDDPAGDRNRTEM